MRLLGIGYLFFLCATVVAIPIVKVDKHFEKGEGCFLLYDLKKDKNLIKYNPAKCAVRKPACSTFKIALALMAFDKGILKDENTPFKWDGKDYGMAGWNKDQTTESWIKESAVWVSQKLTKELGKDTIEKYLRKFGYGTADMSGGIDTAWLTAGTPENKVTKSTLLISANEQVRFLTKLWKEELPVSKHAMDMTKKLLFLEHTPNGYQLSGKTGSGFTGKELDSRLGWFVAHVGNHKEDYISVVTFTTAKKPEGNRYAGHDAKEKMKKLLAELGK